ncbi:Holliday junction resolvase RuvX [Litorivicinus sp.]|nr:Holliday junction resolvase RuvX [Litorivicinus sp.]
MPLALGFDYGLSRIGVATGQTLTKTASPLIALPAKDGTPQWEHIQALLAEWKPDVVVVGLPLHDDGSMSEMAERAKKFGQRIHGRFGVHVEFINEYHSTREAREHLNYRGKAGDQDGKLDATAASVILERWLGEQHA